jgi:hypothetical protein
MYNTICIGDVAKSDYAAPKVVSDLVYFNPFLWFIELMKDECEEKSKDEVVPINITRGCS